MGLSAKSILALIEVIKSANFEIIFHNYDKAIKASNKELAEDILHNVIKFLKENPVYLNATDENGNTLFYFAMQRQIISFMENLFDINLSIKNLAELGIYPKFQDDGLLLMAIQNNYLRGISLLFRYQGLFPKLGLKFNQYLSKNQNYLYNKDNDGNTLLHIATENKILSLMEIILNQDLIYFGDEAELLINLSNSDGKTSLLIALENNYKEGIKLLLENNASFYIERDANGNYLRSQYKYTDYLSNLLSCGQTVTEDFIKLVIKTGRSKIVELQDIIKVREYLNRVASRLVGFLGEGSQFDFKLWADILADMSSKASQLCTIEACFPLGEQFGISVNYLAFHIRSLIELLLLKDTGINETTLIQELLIAVNTAKIDQETTLLQLFKTDNFINSHINGLYKRLTEQAFLCYPGGWPGRSSSQPAEEGHAIYINFAKLPIGYKISCFNLGGGIDKDYNNVLSIGNKLYLPAIKSVSLAENELKTYLLGLVWANCNGVNQKTIQKAISLIYNEDIFERVVKTEANKTQAEIEQSVGNCIVKNYLFSMRTRLGDKHYEALYLQILNIVLKQMRSYCGHIPGPYTVANALAEAEVVFRNKDIKFFSQTISLLPAFSEEISICKDKNKLTSQIGFFKTFYHRGQSLSVDIEISEDISQLNLTTRPQ